MPWELCLSLKVRDLEELAQYLEMSFEIAISKKADIRVKYVLEYGFIMPAKDNQCKNCLYFYKKLWFSLTNSLSSTVHSHIFSKQAFSGHFLTA